MVWFVGIDPPGMKAALEAGGAAGDKGAAAMGVGQAVDEWTRDPHGKGEVLAGKRMKRNPYGVWQGIFIRDERDRGGLVTVGNGEEERLDENAERPWST